MPRKRTRTPFDDDLALLLSANKTITAVDTITTAAKQRWTRVNTGKHDRKLLLLCAIRKRVNNNNNNNIRRLHGLLYARFINPGRVANRRPPWQNYANYAPSRFRARPILQIWPPQRLLSVRRPQKRKKSLGSNEEVIAEASWARFVEAKDKPFYKKKKKNRIDRLRLTLEGNSPRWRIKWFSPEKKSRFLC